MLWKLNALERVPADFNQSLEKILKMYPPPPKAEARKEKPANIQTAAGGKQ
jgi:hypothetical protein